MDLTLLLDFLFSPDALTNKANRTDEIQNKTDNGHPGIPKETSDKATTTTITLTIQYGDT